MPSANLDIVRLVLLQAFEPLETYNLYGPPGPRELTSHRETYSFLSTCCLVSKEWYDVAAPLLYSTITLSSYADEGKDGYTTSFNGVRSLTTTFRLRPTLLSHVSIISSRWDEFITSQFLEQPHSYPNLVRLGSLTIEWWTAEGEFPKVIGLAKRFPSLLELRINLAYIDNDVKEDSRRVDLRSPSIQLPETIKKLSVSGPDGLLFLNAFNTNSLPHLVELEIETFGDGTSTFFTQEHGLGFFQKFGKNLLSLSISHRYVKSETFSIFQLIRHDSHRSCPPSIFTACPSLKTIAIQGLGLNSLLIQGHQNLETVEFGLIDQPRQIASDLEITHHVDLYNRLNLFLHYFEKKKLPLLTTMRVASLDFREASSRNWITLQRSVPLLHDQGIQLYDKRGIIWIDVEKGSSWPSELLAQEIPRSEYVVDKLFREAIVYRAAERLLGGEEEEEEEEEEQGEEIGASSRGGDGDGEEAEKKMPPGMAEALEEGLQSLLGELDVAMEHDHLRNEKKREIMEEKDLTRYADEFAEEEMAKKGMGKATKRP
ncbi:hypothetical protein BDY24DRAFT_376974 [Mrakia frigida]|uniref:uncharacterized protein n=1 Tax=Mrakia frigida TaxID=29902 RepID=UPI003FCC1939